jgi:hypothetical protein
MRCSNGISWKDYRGANRSLQPSDGSSCRFSKMYVTSSTPLGLQDVNARQLPSVVAHAAVRGIGSPPTSVCAGENWFVTGMNG